MVYAETLAVMPRGVSRARGGRTLAGCGGMGASSAREDGLHEGRAGIAGRRGVQMIASRERAGGGRRATSGEWAAMGWSARGVDVVMVMKSCRCAHAAAWCCLRHACH